MNARLITSVDRFFPRSAGIRSLRLVWWWCGFYLALVLFALAEGVLLRHMGVECIPESSLRYASVGDFCISADGRWAAVRMGFRCQSAGARIIEDVVVCDLWQYTTRRLCLSQLEPCCLVISPTGESLAFACRDCSIYVWRGPVEGEPGSEPRNQRAHFVHRVCDTGIKHLDFSPDGQLLAVVGERYTHLLQVQAGVLLHRLVQDGPTNRAAFSADSRWLSVSGFDGEVRRYDARTGQRVEGTVLTEVGTVHTALSADGKLAAYHADRSVAVWNLLPGKELWCRDIAGSLAAANKAIGFSPDGRVLATACVTDTAYQIHCYDAHTNVCLGKSPRYEAIFKGLVVAEDHTVYFWDAGGMIRGWKAGQDREQWRFFWPVETSRSNRNGATPQCGAGGCTPNLSDGHCGAGESGDWYVSPLQESERIQDAS